MELDTFRRSYMHVCSPEHKHSHLIRINDTIVYDLILISYTLD